jgi:hypothetical protein
MTDLDRLDRAVRIVKRDGPWKVVPTPASMGRGVMTSSLDVWYTGDGIAVAGSTVEAIKLAYRGRGNHDRLKR